MTSGEMAEPDRRQRILGAAFDLFVERGYAGTTTQHIAARARVSKRDLYALFGDKAAIMASCIADRSAQMSQPLRLPTPPDRAALEATLAAFGAGLAAELGQPSTVAAYRLAIAEAERAPEVARLLHSAGRMVVWQAAVDLLDACRESGLVAGDPADLANLFFAGLRLDSLLLRRLLGEAGEPEGQPAAARAAEAARAVLAASVR
jgi:AcrR family transcriptional regulator